jgi:hypothetical protein
MSKKKYRLTDEIKPFGKIVLCQIQALRIFGDVKEGDFGGYVESEHNLSHSGNAWVSVCCFQQLGGNHYCPIKTKE